MKKHLITMFFLCIGFTCSFVSADIIVNAGNHDLFENTANQQIDILITTDAADQISGLNLRSTIGDGLGSIAEPVFQGVEGTDDGFDFGGTIFAADSLLKAGEGPAAGAAMIIEGSLAGTSSVTADGILVSMFIDTTGFIAGQTFDLTLDNIIGDTEILGPVGAADPLDNVTLNSGTINIVAVPEPASAIFIIAAVTGIAVRRRRT